MAPTPRKIASSSFNQTWHETDAAFLDPTSLPLSKAPRAWERKTQVSVSRDGKQKKVFRRYTLRSRAANTSDVEEEDDEEERDSLSRPVKKLQRMSPDAMEKNRGKRRIFKATRWDRSKSLLPRKKAAHNDESLVDMDDTINAEVETQEDQSENNDTNALEIVVTQKEGESEPLLEGDRRRATFNFTFDGQHDHAPNVPEPHQDSMLDTIPQFTFRSPTKAASPIPRNVISETTSISPRADQDGTMQSLFRSPTKGATAADLVQLTGAVNSPPITAEDNHLSAGQRASISPSPVLQKLQSPPKKHSPSMERMQSAEDAHSPILERDATLQLLFRSPNNQNSPFKHLGLTEDMDLSPREKHDGATQLLFHSPAKDMSPTKRILFAEDGGRSPISRMEETDLVDSEMSEIVEQEHTVTFYEDCEVHVVTTTVIEDELSPDDMLHAKEVDWEHNTAENRPGDEASVEVPAFSGTDVDHQSFAASANSSAPIDEDQDTEMSEIIVDLSEGLPNQAPSTFPAEEGEGVMESSETTLTEASLQSSLQEDINVILERGIENDVAQGDDVEMSYEEENSNEVTDVVDISAEPVNDSAESQSKSGTPADNMVDDIAEGMSLSFSTHSTAVPALRRLRSLSPPAQDVSLDDATTTVALDDDTAVLKDFLTRAAASKASKVINIARRSSLINRRESDAIRHALASPRKILEDKDPNSPSKYDNDATLDLTQTLTLSADQVPLSLSQEVDAESTGEMNSSRSSRRSTRTRKSRLPAPSPAPQPTQGPKTISLRRNDGTEPVSLKKTEAQELGLLTRNNTRKNKQGAFSVSVKLFSLNTNVSKLATEAAPLKAVDDDAKTSLTDAVSGKKNVRWDETLEYFQQGTDTQANMKADAESLATPDELSLSITTSSSKSKIKTPKDKASTPKTRRTKGLGATNGTPGKGLLGPSSLLPDEVQDEMDVLAPAVAVPRLPKAKSSRIKKMPVGSSSSDTIAVPSSTKAGIPTTSPKIPDHIATALEPTKEVPKVSKERKSRLATPKRVKFPQPVPAALVVEGKENQQTKGIASGLPKKSIPIPVSQVIAPPTLETGLPRRRARKV
ncbi:hypothetical protein K504DRAFT_459659 [Pleomassaria siparia CBS 279.74]|uniref:Uncharacterized protein n=1 Tax=Pleomassaria siparia CBS 279.74 TaxID=1314801 RepID=A0A6G1K0H2_9PLEO|nr:hypothetical protein K504DRAFT_459659 [Pleomassaria siparia CBS 279.74]